MFESGSFAEIAVVFRLFKRYAFGKEPQMKKLVPPDLQMILDKNDAPILLQGRVRTTIAGRAIPLDLQAAFFNEGVPVSVIPEGTRGITTVAYYQIDAPIQRNGLADYGTGNAYLSDTDAYSEPVGLFLATARAVRELIERHQPVNAISLARRVERFGTTAVVPVVDSLDYSTLAALQYAMIALEKAADKCRK